MRFIRRPEVRVFDVQGKSGALWLYTGNPRIIRIQNLSCEPLGEIAASANVPVSVEIYDGMQHLFQGSPTASEAKVSLNRLGQFIKSRTKERAQTSATLKNAKQGG